MIFWKYAGVCLKFRGKYTLSWQLSQRSKCGTVWEQKQDGRHRNDADGPIVFSDELLSAKKIRRMRRSLHTIAKEESVRPGILFSGRSDKNVMISPCHFFSCLPLLNGNATFGRDVWYFGILLLQDIFFSFRRLKIHFLSIFVWSGVMVFENTSAHRASLRRWSWCRWRRNCWNVDGRQRCCPVTASVKQFWRFILVFLLTLEAINKIFSLPLGQAKMSHKDYRIEEKFGKTERGKKRLDHSICFQPCISPERYETLEFSFLIFGICPQTS